MWLVVLVAPAFLLLVAGCSIPIPQAEKDPTRYYVLSTATAAATPPADAPVVHLRQVDIAHYLNARPMIVRRGEHEIEFREFARWGESLEFGISRVLREELLGRGAARAVLTTGVRRDTSGSYYDLNVRVLACEGAASGEVVFRAVWDLSSNNGKISPAGGGDFRAVNLRWDGKTEGSLAAGLSQAVAALAAEISGALKK